MLKIFELVTPKEPSDKVTASSNDITITQHAIEQLKRYYRNSNKHVPNSHILAKLIQSSYSSEQDISEYIRVTTERALATAKLFELTTPTSMGKLLKDTMGSEYVGILANDRYVNFRETQTHFSNLVPVRYVYHPYTHMDLRLPTEVEPGISYVEVNVSVLMYMYRKFRETTGITSPGVFIYSHVFPNMIRGYTDISIFNRMARSKLFIDFDEDGYKHPVSVKVKHKAIDISAKAKRGLSKATVVNYKTLVDRLPTLQYGVRHSLRTPDVVLNGYTLPFIYMSKIPVVEGMVAAGGRSMAKRQKAMFRAYELVTQRIRRNLGIHRYAEDHEHQIDASIKQVADLIDLHT